MQKSELFTAFIESQFGHPPRANDYGPKVIGIETPRKFLCMLSDTSSITHASFVGVQQFFQALWVVEF